MIVRVVIVRSRAIDPSAAKIAATLSSHGYEVALLVWDRAGTWKEDYSAGYTVVRAGLPAPYDSAWAVIMLPLWWLWETVSLLRAKPDIVHACDLDTLLPAILAKLIARSQLCYTIFDFYAANLPPRTPSALRRLVASIERGGVGFADVLFLPDEVRYAQVRGARVRNIVYVYNSPPDHHGSNTKRQAQDLSNLVLLYAGILHQSRGVRQLVSAVAELDGVMLIVAGSGPEQKFVMDAARRLPSRIRFLGHLPYPRVIEETQRADAVVAFYDPALPNTPFASPNKLFEGMMTGKPIITNSECGASRIVEREDCGVIVAYGDKAQIKEAIASLRDCPDWRRRLGANARRAYEREYGWAIMEQRLLDAYSNLRQR